MNLPLIKQPQRLLLAAAVLLAFSAASPAFAQAGKTATGVLTVHATVNSSLELLFDSDSSGVSLSSGAGTNTAELDFTNVSEYGSNPSHVTVSQTPNFCSSCWSISSYVDVKVLQADGASSNYTLNAKLTSTPANSETFSIDGSATPLTSTYSQVTATGQYSNDDQHTVSMGIPNATSDSTSITDTIQFEAVSN